MNGFCPKHSVFAAGFPLIEHSPGTAHAGGGENGNEIIRAGKTGENCPDG